MSRQSAEHHERDRKSKKPMREFRFLDYRLTDDDKSAMEELDLDVEFPLGLLDDLLSEGYKISFSTEEKSGAFIVSITDKRSDSGYYNHCVTSWGDSRLNAWYAACYKHFIVAAEGWRALDTPKATTVVKWR